MILYQVGGCVRDSLLKRKAKDVDFTAVVSSDEAGGDPFGFMVERLLTLGFEVFQVKRAFLTARANFPGGMPFGTERIRGGVDIVLARKDSATSADGRHPDAVTPGGLGDDLARRDFTMNAIARSSTGELIDPHGGVADIASRTIRTVGAPIARMSEDRLRILRALRFAITLDFEIEQSLSDTITKMAAVQGKDVLKGVSHERIREELTKMFACSTVKSLVLLEKYYLIQTLFNESRIWLKPTMEPTT